MRIVRRDIGRVAHDQVVLTLMFEFKPVRLDECDPPQSVGRDVFPGHGQRGRAVIDRDDPAFRSFFGDGDGDGPAAGAGVEHCAGASRGQQFQRSFDQ